MFEGNAATYLRSARLDDQLLLLSLARLTKLQQQEEIELKRVLVMMRDACDALVAAQLSERGGDKVAFDSVLRSVQYWKHTAFVTLVHEDLLIGMTLILNVDFDVLSYAVADSVECKHLLTMWGSL